MKTQIFETLQNLGLTPQEADTYLEFIQFGSGTVSEFTKLIKHPRTTVHDRLQKFQSLGLIKKGSNKGKTIYIAESPSIILEKAKKQIKTTETAVEDLYSIYQKRKGLKNVIFYEHKEGMHRQHEESLTDNIGLRTRYIGEISTLRKSFRKNIDPYIQKRVERGIRNQVITSTSLEILKTRYDHDTNKKELREVKYITNLGSLPATMFNYDDIVWMHSAPESGFVIKIIDKDFATMFNSLFEFFWIAGETI